MAQGAEGMHSHKHGNELGTGLGAAVASAGNVKSVSRGLMF